MKPNYFSTYNNYDLVQDILRQKIQKQFTKRLLSTSMTYQEVLVYLDQQCQKFVKTNSIRINTNVNNLSQNDGSQRSRDLESSENRNSRYRQSLSKDGMRRLFYRAERNISKEIFESCTKDQDQRVTLRHFIGKYIQVLQTAKLCLIRQEAKQQILQYRIKQASSNLRKKTYVYIKLIQASIYSRYSDDPCFQYKISPSNIPTITIMNSLNPIINHEYTLEMDQNQFYIFFYQSGIQIYRWKFQISDFKKDEEFFKSVAAEPVTFQVQIRMLPKQTSEQITELEGQRKVVQEKLQLSKKAFKNLCNYMPFQQFNREQQENAQNKGGLWNFTSSLFSFLPFLKKHLKVLHFVLIGLIFVECLASISWAVQFIDLIIAFGLLGVLYDQTQLNVSMYLWAGLFALSLSTLKTIWGALLVPFGMPKYPLILFIAIIFKIITIFFIWITTIRAEEIPSHRLRDLYGINFQKQQKHHQVQKQIFRKNQNYFKNMNPH